MTAAQQRGTALPAFVVDRRGLAKLLERKGKDFAIVELVQNAWDEDSTHVDVVLERMENETVSVEGDDIWKLVVEDDNPEGFKDLTHAYTLFAESAKKGVATKRGRFNLGEKLVVAICEVAEISTTKGVVRFEGDQRYHGKPKRKRGSVFTGFMRLSDEDVLAIERTISTLLPPEGIVTTFNLNEIPVRRPLATFEVSLRTELADDDGRLRPTTRKTMVEVYEPLNGEAATIYEMGIPVVATGDRYHVNVMQKVPLNTDRDNVPPSYLRDVRAAVLNNMHKAMTADDAQAAWVTNALEDDKIEPEAVRSAFEGRFGERAVIHDPTDPEANKIAAEKGYTVVPGGALPRAAWRQVKSSEVALPAGKVTPSPNPNEGAENLKLMDPAHWPGYVRNVVDFAKAYATKLLALDEDIEIRIVNDTTWPFAATYGPRRGGTTGILTLNIGRLGHRWFQAGISREVIDLLIHEFGHHYESDHLSRRYLDALTMLAGLTWEMALEQPGFFTAYDCAVVPA